MVGSVHVLVSPVNVHDWQSACEYNFMLRRTLCLLQFGCGRVSESFWLYLYSMKLIISIYLLRPPQPLQITLSLFRLVAYVYCNLHCILKGDQSGCLRSPHAPVAELSPNFSGIWSTYRRVSQGDQCAQISCNKGACGENSHEAHLFYTYVVT